MFLNRNFINRSELTLTVEDQHPYITTTARHAGYSQLIHTAKNQHQKLETNISRKGIARPQSQFPH